MRKRAIFLSMFVFFEPQTLTWAQPHYFQQTILGLGAGNGFVAASSDGSTLAVGGATGVTVFTKVFGVYTRAVELIPSANSGNAFRLCDSVAMSGDGSTVICGLDGAIVGSVNGGNGPGEVFVWVKPASGWNDTITRETTVLYATDLGTNAGFGRSVAASQDGRTLLVGAEEPIIGPYGGNGAAYVFVEPAAGWPASTTETAKLTASDGMPNERFGVSVAISGDGNRAAVASFISADGITPIGEGYVFEKAPLSSWTNTNVSSIFRPSIPAVGFGFSIAMSKDGNTVVIGAEEFDLKPGAAFVFARTAAGWPTSSETAVLTPSDGVACDDFGGDSVAISGDGSIVLAGAPLHAATVPPGGGCQDAGPGHGATYVFSRPGGGWTDSFETAELSSSNVNGSGFGTAAISADASIVVVLASNINLAYIFAVDAAPVVNCGTPDGLWHALDVSIPCSASDSSSGLLHPADTSFNLTTSVTPGTETSSALTNSYKVFDTAGSSTTAGSIGPNMVDKKPPSITCGHPDGLWHATDIAIACIAIDGGSGLANLADGNFVLTTSVSAGTETSNAVTTTHNVSDKVGNSSTAGPIAGNMVDEKPPAITISQPTEATYTHSSILTLNYTITDGGSGVGSITPTLNGSATAGGSTITNGLPIRLLTALPLGPNTFALRASDKVGNTSSASVTFTIVVTAQSMLDDVTQLQASGAITLNGNSLLAKLNSALASRARGECGAAGNVYAAFVNDVKAQTGKGITPAAAAILIADALYLETNCP